MSVSHRQAFSTCTTATLLACLNSLHADILRHSGWRSGEILASHAHVVQLIPQSMAERTRCSILCIRVLPQTCHAAHFIMVAAASLFSKAAIFRLLSCFAFMLCFHAQRETLRATMLNLDAEAPVMITRSGRLSCGSSHSFAARCGSCPSCPWLHDSPSCPRRPQTRHLT